MTDILPLQKPDGTQFYPLTHAQAVIGLASAILSGQVIVSVNGKTGAVVLTAADVGLDHVDNTADTDKPVSAAQQVALDGKQDKLLTSDNGTKYSLKVANDGTLSTELYTE